MQRYFPQLLLLNTKRTLVNEKLNTQNSEKNHKLFIKINSKLSIGKSKNIKPKEILHNGQRSKLS